MTPMTPNIEFLNEKERREWVNFLKFGCIGCTIGGSVDWNFGRTIQQQCWTLPSPVLDSGSENNKP